MSPVEFKKRPCRPVEFKGQGLQRVVLQGGLLPTCLYGARPPGEVLPALTRPLPGRRWMGAPVSTATPSPGVSLPGISVIVSELNCPGCVGKCIAIRVGFI